MWSGQRAKPSCGINATEKAAFFSAKRQTVWRPAAKRLFLLARLLTCRNGQQSGIATISTNNFYPWIKLELAKNKKNF